MKTEPRLIRLSDERVAQLEALSKHTPNKANSFERFLIQQRAYCEEPHCLREAKVCRAIDGHHKVFCFAHDPEQIQDMISWLETRQDAIVPDSFEDWLRQNDDSLLITRD